MSELTRPEAQAVVDALNRMFKSERCFSICTVDSCMKITRVPQDRRYEVLRLYHCVGWADMNSETKQMIFETTVDLVCGGGFFPEIRLVTPAENSVKTVTEKPSMLRRLFGG